MADHLRTELALQALGMALRARRPRSGELVHHSDRGSQYTASAYQTVLATHGWELRRETLIRQSRPQAESEEWWRKLCLSADGLKGFEAWGALIDNKLVAALLGFTCDEFFSILYHQSLTEYLPYAVNNALAYVVTSEVLQRPSHPKLFYGLHSLDAPPSVDNFKFRMGYWAKPVRQRVELHPLLRPFVNPISHSVLHTACRVFPMNATLSKTEGMFRLFLENKLAVSSRNHQIHSSIPFNTEN